MTTEEMIAETALNEIVRLKKERERLRVFCILQSLALVAALVFLWI